LTKFLEETEKGSHGDHWASVFGFDDLIEKKVYESFDDLELEKIIKRDTRIYRAKYGLLSGLGIEVDEKIITFYPSLDSSKNIPVTVKSILEWKHSYKKEAQIIGSGRDEFALNFFATDYAENREKYIKGGVLNIALVGFAYIIDSDEIQDVDYTIFSKEFCVYLPSSTLDTGYDFDFIGQVVDDSKNVKYNKEEMLFFDVKLINNDEFSFILPMVVNPKNMRVDSIKKGDMISGCFWLQGRISE
jgi:hypothetical protein